jgi:CHAP domain
MGPPDAGPGSGRLPHVAEVIARAVDQRGVLEQDDNRTPFARDLDDAFGPILGANGNKIGRYGQPWCAVFQSWAYWRSCERMHPLPNGGFFTPADLKAWRKLDRVVGDPQPGDLAYYLRDGEPHHVGLVIAVDGQRYSTIEGNTTPNSKVTPNGIGVFQFGPFQDQKGDVSPRTIADDVVFARPEYAPAITRRPLPEEEDEMPIAWQDARFRNLFWSQSGMPLSPADLPHITDTVVEPAHDQKLAAMCHAAWGVTGATAAEIIRVAQESGLLLPVRGRGG